jgi:hypothetical protein
MADTFVVSRTCTYLMCSSQKKATTIEIWKILCSFKAKVVASTHRFLFDTMKKYLNQLERIISDSAVRYLRRYDLQQYICT